MTLFILVEDFLDDDQTLKVAGVFNVDTLMILLMHLIDAHDLNSFGLFICDVDSTFSGKTLDECHIIATCFMGRGGYIFDVATCIDPTVYRLSESEFQEFLANEDPEDYRH